MSALINFSLDLSKLPKDKIVTTEKGGKWINLTASVNEETRYGNNVSFSISQSKEERESKEPKTYIGNGKVVWNDGKITNALKEEDIPVNDATLVSSNEEDDLPF